MRRIIGLEPSDIRRKAASCPFLREGTPLCSLRSRRVSVEPGGRAKQEGVRVAYPFLFGSPCWTRTSDTLINSQVLYRLS